MALGHWATDYLGPKEDGGSGGGGGRNFIIEASFESVDIVELVDESINFSDIVDAYNAGKRIIIYMTGTMFLDERYVEMTSCQLADDAIARFDALYYDVLASTERILSLYEDEGTVYAYVGTVSTVSTVS